MRSRFKFITASNIRIREESNYVRLFAIQYCTPQLKMLLFYLYTYTCMHTRRFAAVTCPPPSPSFSADHVCAVVVSPRQQRRSEFRACPFVSFAEKLKFRKTELQTTVRVYIFVLVYIYFTFRRTCFLRVDRQINEDALAGLLNRSLEF